MQQVALRCNRLRCDACDATGSAAVQRDVCARSSDRHQRLLTGMFVCARLFCATVRFGDPSFAHNGHGMGCTAATPHAVDGGSSSCRHRSCRTYVTVADASSEGLLLAHLAIGVEVRVEPDGPVASRHVLHRWRRLGVVRWQQDVEQETAVLVPARPVPTWPRPTWPRSRLAVALGHFPLSRKPFLSPCTAPRSHLAPLPLSPVLT